MRPIDTGSRRAGGYRGAGWRTAALAAACAALLLATGCGDRAPEIGEGCVLDDAVSPEVRSAVEQAAAGFLDHARQGEWEAIWAETATEAREASPQQQFLGSVQRVASTIGIPPAVETVSLAVIGFGESFPYRERLVQPVAGEQDSLLLYLPSHPVQASLVQRSVAAPEAFYYSTLWFLEEGQWKLATFFAKPATAYGRDWEHYADLASEQRLAENKRNAAILYNLAIDLVVPAAWIKPPEVERLQKIQRRIAVDRLPAGRISRWPSSPDTFLVVSVQYNLLPSGLGLLMGYESVVAAGDTAAQTAYAARLHRYVTAEFPEYPEVFSTVALQAYDPATHKPFWVRTYPLGKNP